MEEKQERNTYAEDAGADEGTNSFAEDFENSDDIINKITAQEKSEKNKTFGVFSMQFSLCIILVTIILFCKIFVNGVYVAFCEQYEEAFISESNLINIDEIKDVLTDFINDFKPLSRGDSDTENESSKESSGSSESEEGTGGEQNAISDSDNTVPDDATLDAVAFPGTLRQPVKGGLTSVFGFREYPLNGEPDFHKGIDIQAEEGTKIIAAYGGEVTIADYSVSYGNYIIIDHENGFNSLYAHCKKLLVGQGDTVKKGKAIATVGSTGASTGNHLHFGLQYNGVWVNPLDSFPKDTYAAI